MAERSPIRILIVDDQPLFRSGLARLLAEDGRVAVAGQAADGSEALDLAERLAPDVVLMDIRMPGMNGIEATARIMAAQPRTRVLMMTTFDTDGHIVEARRAGACGYVLKDSTPGAIVTSVVAVMEDVGH